MQLHQLAIFAYAICIPLCLSSHFGSGIVLIDGVGRISCGHCFYHSLPFCSITCILFRQSIFCSFHSLHVFFHVCFVLPLPLLQRTSNFKTFTITFSSCFHQNMTVPPHAICFSHPIQAVRIGMLFNAIYRKTKAICFLELNN